RGHEQPQTFGPQFPTRSSRLTAAAAPSSAAGRRDSGRRRADPDRDQRDPVVRRRGLLVPCPDAPVREPLPREQKTAAAARTGQGRRGRRRQGRGEGPLHADLPAVADAAAVTAAVVDPAPSLRPSSSRPPPWPSSPASRPSPPPPPPRRASTPTPLRVGCPRPPGCPPPLDGSFSIQPGADEQLRALYSAGCLEYRRQN
ncbi:hypothetical protein U9M48_014638, partial [Paspalum notatum var. saurae]